MAKAEAFGPSNGLANDNTLLVTDVMGLVVAAATVDCVVTSGLTTVLDVVDEDSLRAKASSAVSMGESDGAAGVSPVVAEVVAPFRKSVMTVDKVLAGSVLVGSAMSVVTTGVGAVSRTAGAAAATSATTGAASTSGCWVCPVKDSVAPCVVVRSWAAGGFADSVSDVSCEATAVDSTTPGWVLPAVPAVLAGVSASVRDEPEDLVLLIAPPVLTATPAGAEVVVEPLVVDVALDANSEDLLEEPAVAEDAEESDGSELDAGDEVDAAPEFDEEAFALDAEELLDEDSLLDEGSPDPVSAHAVP